MCYRLIHECSSISFYLCVVEYVITFINISRKNYCLQKEKCQILKLFHKCILKDEGPHPEENLEYKVTVDMMKFNFKHIHTYIYGKLTIWNIFMPIVLAFSINIFIFFAFLLIFYDIQNIFWRYICMFYKIEKCNFSIYLLYHIFRDLKILS